MIDTHSHLYDTAFDLDRADVLARVAAAGVDTVMLPGIDSSTHDAMFALARECTAASEAVLSGTTPLCLPMMGLHPTSVNDNPRWREELAIVERTFASPPMPLWGVGETGIDLHWSRDFLREQEEAFRRQIELSLLYDLPLVLHARDAWPEVFRILDDYRTTSHTLRSGQTTVILSEPEHNEIGVEELFAERTIAERASTVANFVRGGDILRAKQSSAGSASAANPKNIIPSERSESRDLGTSANSFLNVIARSGEAATWQSSAGSASVTSPKPRLRGVMHAFSGGIEEYLRIRELGDFVFGISGVATYKRGSLDEVIRAMDLNHIVLETDSPYLTPEPHRGTRNDSSLLPLICARVAAIRGVDAALISTHTTLNARRIFGL